MTCCGFRPLSGSYISQYSFAFLFLYQFLTVSVPYRGATFLNEVFKYYEKKNKPVSVPYRGATFLNDYRVAEVTFNEFPSPIGELHFSICQRIFLICFYQKVFPSPIGELHFSIQALVGGKMLPRVSVPYRGATFLNSLRSSLRATKQRFRPLSGSYISQSYLYFFVQCLL